MGNRDYKKFAPGCIYHVYNRGVNKINIFNDIQDNKLFLSRLRENLFPELKLSEDVCLGDSRKIHTPYKRKKLPAKSFDLIAYCLMPNHFHLLIKQNNNVSVSKLIGKVCTSYSKYFNLKHKRVGSLFQDQFKAVYVDSNEYLLWLSAYIHLNPVMANLVKYVENWKWSSYLEYINHSAYLLCNKGIILNQYKKPKLYHRIVNDSLIAMQKNKFSETDISYAEFEPLDGAHQG